MRLTTVFRASAILVGVSGALAAGLLVFSTTRLRHQTEQLATASENIRAAEGLERTLLMHDRERRLLVSTGLAEHTAAMTALRDRTLSWMTDVKAHVDSRREEELVEALDKHLSGYFLAIDANPSAPGSPPELGEAVAVATQLLDINVADADGALDAADRINLRAIIAALVVSCLLIVSLFVTLVLARREVYSPIVELHSALRAFASRDGTALLHSHGVQELKDVANEYNRLVEQLRAAEERQLRFLAGVAHDLKNPLGALKLTAAMLARGREGSEDEQLRRGLQRIGSQVDNLSRMVGDLLDRTRIEAGNVELRIDRCDLRAIAEEVVDLHRPVTETHQFTLEAPPEPVEIPCDRMRLQQVLTNLVSNAIKYSPEGGHILVRVLEDGTVEVQDQGLGIAPEDRHRIFEPFHRTRGAAADIPGVGLGLSVSRKIVEAHGGRIEVDSEPGKGSTFRVHLPRADA